MNWLATLPFHTYAVREDGANGPPRSGTRSPFGHALIAVELDQQNSNDQDED